VLFRGGAEERIRTKLLKDGHIDTVIGLPANLFFSTGIPVCILILKRCKKPDDVLFINASAEGNFEKGKRQNRLLPEHIDKIVSTYQYRNEETRYSRRGVDGGNREKRFQPEYFPLCEHRHSRG
jgi:type I restriction enzyme M protein